MKDSNDILDLLYRAAQKIAEYTAGYDFADFSLDSKTQSAVIMQLVIIGELAKGLDESVQSKIDLPWKLMAGFRDFAVHQYFSLDLEQIWDTATENVPDVAEKLQEFLQTNENGLEA